MISKRCNYERRGRKTNLDWTVRNNFTEDKKKKSLILSPTSQVKHHRFNMKHQKLVILLLPQVI